MRTERGKALLGGLAGVVMLTGPGIATADHWRFAGGWGPSVAESGVNLAGPSEGCPIETPDGLSLIIASNRSTGIAGNNDLWAADRTSIDAPFGEPHKLGDPISLDTSSEFCPFPYDRSLLFVSTRGDGCGGGDIYYTRQSLLGIWSDPVNLGCAPNGPNTDDTEYSPMLIETWYGTFLFFSTAANTGDQNIYVSVLGSDGTFGPGRIVSSLSSPDADFMPNIRRRDRGGFEVVFNSNRATWGRRNMPAFGGQDVYTATALWLPDAWTVPVNVGANVNTAGNETRATLSADGERLHFGRDGDIYVSER